MKLYSRPAVEVDWNGLQDDLRQIFSRKDKYGNSPGPIIHRLAWHSAATYDKKSNTGGTEGAGMRYLPESGHPANAGLHKARSYLAPLKVKHQGITYSDLWSFAGTFAVEVLGGPKISWRPGRQDHVEGEGVFEEGRIPDGAGDPNNKVDIPTYIRGVFARMGFNDQEMVALCGGHTLGGCAPKNSGFSGAWTDTAETFNNEYFQILLFKDYWTLTTNKAPGKEEYTDPRGKLMMLPTDMALVSDPELKKWVEIYAKDQQKFFDDFSLAWTKLQENGVKSFQDRT